MKRLLLLLLLIPALAAAKVPDEDNIIDRTMDSESPYYYPALMLRYNAGDATLTDEDYHYLYYGYAYQDDYKPLATNPDLDKMLMLGDSRTEVKIISTRSDEIRTAILAEIDRGVTVLHGEGGYTGEPSEVLLSVISNRELPRLEKLVHSIDPACFLIVSRVTEVSGRGFSMEKEYQ